MTDRGAGRKRHRHPAGGTVMYGDGAVARVPEVAAGLGARRVLLVCGRRSFEASGAARMLPALERVAEVRRWSDFAPNADADDLADGLAVLRSSGADLVLGIGGGSAMDMAKLLCAYDDLDDTARLHERIRSGAAVTARRRALLQVPTTSGSGSEATHFAVVYSGDDKFSVADPSLRADAAVLDPALTLSAPPYQRATSGIDAVCQAIESLWAAGATAASRTTARGALRLLLHHIEPFVHDGSAVAARGMAIGSHLAGRAIDVSKTTAAHALSYGFTKRHGVDHGQAVALTLGPFIRAHGDAGDDRLQPGVDAVTHRRVLAEIAALLDADDPATGADAFVALAGRLGLATRPSEVGVEREDQRAALAASVNVERLGNNPVRFDRDDLTNLLRAAG